LLDVDRYRETAGYQGYGEVQAEYRLNTGGTYQKYAPGGEGLYMYYVYLYLEHLYYSIKIFIDTWIRPE